MEGLLVAGEADGGGELTLEVLGPVRELLECAGFPAFAARVESEAPS